MKMKNIFRRALVPALLTVLAAATARAADKVSMGFIYVGPKDDYGYNQAHSEGCAGVQKLDWVPLWRKPVCPKPPPSRRPCAT